MKVRVQFTVDVNPEAIMAYALVDRTEIRDWVKSFCRTNSAESLADVHYEYVKERDS